MLQRPTTGNFTGPRFSSAQAKPHRVMPTPFCVAGHQRRLYLVWAACIRNLSAVCGDHLNCRFTFTILTCWWLLLRWLHKKLGGKEDAAGTASSSDTPHVGRYPIRCILRCAFLVNGVLTLAWEYRRDPEVGLRRYVAGIAKGLTPRAAYFRRHRFHQTNFAVDGWCTVLLQDFMLGSCRCRC